MKRKEQIEKAAFEHINSDAVSPMNMQLAFGDFINGAEWADKTMIEKACEWIKENFVNYTGVDVSPYYIYDDEFVEDFRKEMEK